MGNQASNTFTSNAFDGQLREVDLAGTVETVMAGYNDDGTRNLEGLGDAMDGVDQLAIVGWSSQGPAQAQNLRDSFDAAGVDTKVVVGLRPKSKSRSSAEASIPLRNAPQAI